MTHPLFERQPVPYALSPKTSNPKSLKAVVDAAVEMLSNVGLSHTLSRRHVARSLDL